jgi:ribosomal 50S subunit-recycling heat shock protein
LRLDKFLKISRILKRRTVANAACDGGRVTVNGKTAKPSLQLKTGDIIEISLGNNRLCVRVLALPPYIKKEEAQNLFEVISE